MAKRVEPAPPEILPQIARSSSTADPLPLPRAKQRRKNARDYRNHILKNVLPKITISFRDETDRRSEKIPLSGSRSDLHKRETSSASLPKPSPQSKFVKM